MVANLLLVALPAGAPAVALVAFAVADVATRQLLVEFSVVLPFLQLLTAVAFPAVCAVAPIALLVRRALVFPAGQSFSHRQLFARRLIFANVLKNHVLRYFSYLLPAAH